MLPQDLFSSGESLTRRSDAPPPGFCYAKNHTPFFLCYLTAYTKSHADHKGGLLEVYAPIEDDIFSDEIKAHFSKLGVGTISVTTKRGALSYKISKTGKTLKIINPFPLTTKDFRSHMCESDLLCGVTGDISLIESLSLKKVPL